jgi:hypothetical protein
MAGKEKKTATVIPFPSWPRKAVRAAKVEYLFATCTCGEKIKLEPGPVQQTSGGVHFPVLVGIICPRCHSEMKTLWKFKDIQTYKRAHGQDIRKSKKEK